MQDDWKSAFSRRLQKAASVKGRRMASVRWQKDRKRRDALAAITAEQMPSRIVRRIVVIDNENTVRECTIWSFDSARSARRKVRALKL